MCVRVGHFWFPRIDSEQNVTGIAISGIPKEQKPRNLSNDYLLFLAQKEKVEKGVFPRPEKGVFEKK